MKIPLSWLKDYVKVKMPIKKLAERLTEVGLTIENIKEEDGDIILEAEITPNRPDWLSIVGVAREVAAICRTSLTLPEIKTLPKPRKKLPIKIVNNFALIPRYTAVIIDGVTVKPSPLWLQKRIKQVGLRPINNLVDITNYVMFEFGNPLHAFDYDKINPKQMVVQQAKGGEEFISVDEISYKLPKGAIIIKDSPSRVIDLCGIKGGLNSGISQTTKTVFLHTPTHPPALIRRTSQALAIKSDASQIFERGADMGGTLNALKRAATLIMELAGGEIASEVFDLKQKEFTPRKLKLRLNYLEKILGIKIPDKEVLAILNSLNLSPKLTEKNTITVIIPAYRGDLKIEEDLVEEVARIYGYNRFPKTLPRGETPSKKIPYFKDYSLEKKAKQILVGAGYTEIYTHSLISAEALRKSTLKNEVVIEVSNPVSQEFKFLRPSLIPGLLSAISLNLANFKKVKLFELGAIYPSENLALSGIANEDYYQVKGVVELLLNELGIEPVKFIPYLKKDLLYYQAKTAIIETNQKIVGKLGEISNLVLSAFGIKGKITIFDLDFKIISETANLNKKYTAFPSHPPVVEDFAFILPPKVFIQDLIQLIKQVNSIIQSVNLLDTHENIRTLRVIYQHPQKTLTNKEVEKIREEIIRKAKERFGIKIKQIPLKTMMK